MYIAELRLTNFKNYPDMEAIFSPRINCLVGRNGVGKTNVLDALHYLMVCKSYFQSSDAQNIRHGEEYFAIHGDFLGGDQLEKVSCLVKRGQRKTMRLNNKEYERLSDHIGLFPTVMISPYDRDLILDGSEVRRKFMDVVISQFDKNYLEHLIAYNNALEQRNRMLKSDFIDAMLCEVFNEQLVHHGNIIYASRRDFFDAFLPLFQKYFSFISGGSERVGIVYQSSLDSPMPFLDRLHEQFGRDKILQYTSVGIHKDDLQLLMDDYPVKKIGSQGQQKSFTIAMRLAQLEFTRKVKGFNPILLLDDVFDKLDAHRVERLIELVGGDDFGQVFITDTDKERLEQLLLVKQMAYKLFTIADQILQENG